jgi:hypothetical protein
MTDRLDGVLDPSRRLDAPGSPEYRRCVAEASAALDERGCAVVRDLIEPRAVQMLNAEITARRHTTHYSTQSMNPYFHVAPDRDYPDHHPVNTFLERSSGFIPGDSWDDECLIDRLFRHPPLLSFVADCLRLPALHCYDDPLAGLTANVLDPGQQFTWHFDTNDFAVTLLVQAADAGGTFEYAPSIRSGDDEGFERIQAVLDGADDRPVVHRLDLRPGDLQIFRGRYSLHRVTRVAAHSRPRHAAIFAYTERPGVIGRVERTRQLFGRVLPVHEAAEAARVRSDALLD